MHLPRPFPSYDPGRFDQNTTRRLKVLDWVCLAFAVVLVVHFAVLVVHNIVVWDLYWDGASRGYLTQLSFAAAFLIIIQLFRFGYRVKLYAFFILIAVYVTYYAFEHRAGGSQFVLFATPCVTVFFIGTRRWIEVILVSLAAYTLAFHITIGIPWDVPIEEIAPSLIGQRIGLFYLNYNFSAFTWMLVIFGTGATMLLATFHAYREVERAEALIEAEHARSELLLQSLLPRSIAARLKYKPDEEVADEFDAVSILFADIVGFTNFASNRPASEVVHFLNAIFSQFDALAEKHQLEKIKTIGDEYMVAGGMPDPRDDHAWAVAEMALDMMRIVEEVSKDADYPVTLRIGLHTGPAVAGVIGRNKPFYDVWGDTINMASRMQSTGEPGRVQVTEDMMKALSSRYEFQSRGLVDVKGQGLVPSYFVQGAKRAEVAPR